MNDIVNIQCGSSCEGQDSDASYSLLNRLRDQGLQEAFFSLHDDVQLKEYKDLLCDLDLYKLPYKVLEVEGVTFVFMTDAVVNAIGVQARRVCAKTVLRTKPEAE